MTAWHERAHEERHLLNPAFCSVLLWQAGKGSFENFNSPRISLSFNEAFLILPLVLHQKTRNSLPSRLISSFPVWINDNPLVVESLPQLASSLVPYTKAAIIFGETGELFRFKGDEMLIILEREPDIRAMVRKTSNEVQQCMKKAHFLGKWFTHTGSPETIFTLLGIRP
ncbi:three component ABC system middle component [Prosthecochloris sp.]|uniref:three component ABC system middle component n=1 Tax=Prosthecochloris sp. TaxID=290513 RepID=UPI00257F27EB|nr:three component ABC system middle component [Prosthecochloris sp.]